MPTLPSGEEFEKIDNARKSRPARKGGWKKHYVFDFNLKFRPDNIRFADEATIDFQPPEGQLCGFKPLLKNPKIVVEHGGARALLDLTPSAALAKFFVTDRLKRVVTSVDSAACEFVKCDVEFADGGHAQDYWVCEVVRILDAFDDEHSSFKKSRRPGRDWIYSVGYPFPLYVKDDVVDHAGAHLFRLKLPDGRASTQAYCDDFFRMACKEAGITGIDFRRTDQV